MTQSGSDVKWPKAEYWLLYFVALFVSLFATLEGELAHWITLVLLPFLGIVWVARRGDPSVSFLEITRSLGLHWPEGGRGVPLAVVLAVVVQGFQLMNGPQRRELALILSSGGAVWVIPSAFLLLMMTAAFTEEFFFRGILQRSLMARLGGWRSAIVLTSIAFSLYHLPYAYLDAGWPSVGDIVQASRVAFTTGVMGGVALGLVFVRAGGSLLPSVFLHACINWIPAIRLVARLWLSGNGGL